MADEPTRVRDILEGQNVPQREATESTEVQQKKVAEAHGGRPRKPPGQIMREQVEEEARPAQEALAKRTYPTQVGRPNANDPRSADDPHRA